MKIALITIGDEILSGFTTNSNAAWIGQELLKVGANVGIQLSVSDKKKDILQYLQYLTDEKFTHIIVTGGLGPTHDDVTQTTFYEYFGAKEVFDEEYWEQLKHRFEKRNIKIPEKNRNQAVRPDIGEIIDNPLGSARGLYFVKSRIKYFAMPGVPTEMKAMMESAIIPKILADSESQIFVKTIKTIGLGESAIAEKLDKIIQQNKSSITIAFLPQLSRVDIRLFANDESKLNQVVSEVEEILTENIYGHDDDTIEDCVAKLLLTNHLSVATAESCTGGLLAHRLTNVAGSSKYMLGGIICYSNDVKIEKIGVKKETIIKYGAVSSETATELAVGIQRKFKSDVGIGITGIAGPDGGTTEKPVGLVYIGLAIEKKLIVKKFQFVKNRRTNKLLSSQTALNMLRLQLIR